jgi:7,8-dihydroneopterin aldolase/epimerase/oxygenase
VDKIIIQEARLQARVGISEAERAEPQEIVLDIEAFRDLRPAGLSDDYNDTVCYAAMLTAASRVVTGQPYHLIEAMAENVAAALLGEFEINRVLVRVRKPGALAGQNARYAGVEIVREKNG